MTDEEARATARAMLALSGRLEAFEKMRGATYGCMRTYSNPRNCIFGLGHGYVGTPYAYRDGIKIEVSWEDFLADLASALEACSG